MDLENGPRRMNGRWRSGSQIIWYPGVPLKEPAPTESEERETEETEESVGTEISPTPSSP